MAIDNRTTLNDCSATTGWTGDDSVSVITDAGQFYEGSSSLSTQLSNSFEEMYTTSIGGTRDLSDSTVFMLLKDNLVESVANGGVQIIIGDGTDRIGFFVGGNDAVGLPLPTFFNSYKLDVSNRASLSNNIFAGSVANLTTTSITQTGYGTIHLAKAVGSIDNVFMDRFSFIDNASYAMTVNSGTSGTPDTFADVVADDVTGGWGMISNPEGTLYSLFASTEFGDSAAADSYFDDSDFQLFLLGGEQGAGNFLIRTVANASQTHRLRWSNAVVVNTGTRAVIDFTDANFDDLQFDNVTFTNTGTISFPTTTDALRFLTGCTFNNCDLLDFGDTTVTDSTINGSTRADGALVLDANTARVDEQTGLIFNSDGTGHAFEIAPTGSGPFTYNLAGWLYSGYAGTDGSTGNEVLFVNPATLSADITINISAGGVAPTVRTVAGYTGTLTINNNTTITLTGMRDNTEVRVCDQASPPGELAGIETATDGTADNRSFTFTLAAGVIVDITILNVNYILPPNNRIEDFEIPSNDTSLPISQVFDRVFSNP